MRTNDHRIKYKDVPILNRVLKLKLSVNRYYMYNFQKNLSKMFTVYFFDLRITSKFVCPGLALI